MIITKKIVNREKKYSSLTLTKYRSIEIDEPNIFNGLTFINLSHCKLEILESGTFANLNSLVNLFLNNNNLIYFNNNLQHHCNINLNGNFLNNENHPLLTPLRNYLGNIEQNLSHYEYFKTIINESNFNDLINYLANIHKDLFSKNIFIIFYIITHYLLNINIFTSELEIKVIINKFLDNYIDSYTKKFIKHLKITNQQNTNIQIKNYFSSKFNSYIIEQEFNMVLLRMLKSLLNLYINTDFKNTFIKKISIIKNYIMTKNVSQNYKKNSNIMTKNISQNYKKNYNIIMNSNSISKKIGNRVELNMLIKSINEKFKLPNNINSSNIDLLLNSLKKVIYYKGNKNIEKKQNNIKRNLIKELSNSKNNSEKITEIVQFFNHVSSTFISKNNQKNVLFIQNYKN